METHLSGKYSSLLDIEDVESLFENLKGIHGSIRKAADKCGVARSTAYGWEKAKYVKSITRTKILKASLEENLIETLGFLTNKSKERTSDLLLTYLSSIYQKAIRADREMFQNLLPQFLNARQEHFGLIQDALQDEVNKIVSVLIERAIEFQIRLPQDSLDMIKSSYLLKIMPDLMRDIFIERVDLREIANRYGVPFEIPITIENAWKAVIPRLTKTLAQQITTARVWIDSRTLAQPIFSVRWGKGWREWRQTEELLTESPEFVAMKAKYPCTTTKANPITMSHARVPTTPQYVS